MKKIFSFALLSIFSLSAFGEEPYDLVINSMQDLEKHKQVIRSMPETDRNTFIRYIMRKEFLKNLNQGKLPDDVNIADAIKNQLAFEKERDHKLQKEKQLEDAEKAKKESLYLEFNRKFELSVVGASREKNVLNKDILVLVLNLKNNSDKSIIAVQPEIQFILGEDKQTILSIHPKKFENVIQPNDSGKFDFGFDLDNMFALKAEKNVDKLKAVFKGAEVLFSDGTTEKLK